MLIYISALLLIITCGLQLEASNRCTTFSEGQVQSVCAGRILPADRVRNKTHQQLVCSVNADHYFRRPQKFDFYKWNDILRQNGADAAQAYMQTLPEIAWSGTIPFQTVEVWDWQSCEFGTSSFHCGTHEECHNVSRSRTTYSRDSKGNSTSNTSYYTERVCEQVANSCYYDHDHSEAMPCSNETMTYKAKFVRPSKSEWNIKSAGYDDSIANKYDLLPGESEVVQVFNNTERSARLTPNVKLDQKWNTYQASVSGSGVNAQCVQNSHYSIDIGINTLKRNLSAKSPNAFKLPVDLAGNSVDFLGWRTAKAKDGKYIEKGKPTKLILQDSSAAMVSAVFEQNRSNAERTQALLLSGKAQNKDGMTDLEQTSSPGFWKNTVVRVRLEQENRMWWNTNQLFPLYTSDIKSVVASNNVMSRDQEIATADVWEIPLRDIYTNKKGREFGLKPNRNYIMKVSMYQRGFKFYQQSCEDEKLRDPNAKKTWDCNGFVKFIGMGRKEKDYFSDAIELRFSTDKNVDERGFWESSSWLGIGNMLDWMVYKRPAGGSK